MLLFEKTKAVTRNNKIPPKSQYSGPLTDPVVFCEAPLAAQILGVDHPDVAPLLQAETERVTQAVLDKLPLLLDHFGIPREASDKWLQLSYKLARAHVSGFQTVDPKKAGAPQEWGELELAALHIEVGILTKQGMTAMDACRALVRLPDGGWRFPRSRDAKTLYRRYQQAKKLPLSVFVSNIPDAEIKQIVQESIVETVAEDKTPR